MLGLGGNIQNDKIPKRVYTSGSTLLDGTNDYLKQDDGVSIIDLISPANTSFSISFYFMMPGSGATGQVMLITKTKAASGDGFFWLYTNGSSDLSVQASNDEAGSGLENQIVGTWDTNFVKGTWYHITVTSDRSGTNSNTLAYVNGDVVTRSVHATTASNVALLDTNNDAYMSMGTFSIDTNHFIYYNVHIDELAVWNSVLTADEITEIADKYPNLTQNVGDYASSGTLLRYYRMGQDTSASAISINDMSGNGGAPLAGINSPTTSTTKPY